MRNKKKHKEQRGEQKRRVEEWLAAGKGQDQVQVTAAALVCCFGKRKVRKEEVNRSAVSRMRSNSE